jgi:pimeloyl-ACP methyl ester carboxylesterase
MGDHDEMQTFRVAGAEIEYSDRGEGQPLLLIHAGVFADWFVPLASSPMLEGFRVIRVRRAGYTSGSAPTSHLTIGAHAQHCAQLLDTLGIERAHVVGHSSSALIAVELAATRPELVRSLVLVEPPLAGSLLLPAEAAMVQPLLGPAFEAAAAGDIAIAFDAFMTTVCAPDYREVLEAALGSRGLLTAERDSGFFFVDEVPAVLDWTFDAAAAAGVTQPALVVQGGGSPPIVHDVAARLAGWLPHAEMTTVEDADHLLPLRDPAALARLTFDFATRH